MEEDKKCYHSSPGLNQYSSMTGKYSAIASQIMLHRWELFGYFVTKLSKLFHNLPFFVGIKSVGLISFLSSEIQYLLLGAFLG